jgi:SM-20-related protein
MVPYTSENILNPNLDLAAYRNAFERVGRVRISDVFNQNFAEELHNVFEKTPWRVTYRLNNEIVSLLGKEFHALSQAQRNELRTGILAETLKGYQFCYLHMPLTHPQSTAWDPQQVLPTLDSFIGAPAFFDLGRAVTGVSELARTDSVATCYMREHLLTAHPDAPIDKRLVAYVFSFTKNWKIDWGGLLQFHDDENCTIIDSYVPAFNALTIFRVPQWHSVSYVTPFAMGPRYAVAGWYHGDKSAA